MLQHELVDVNIRLKNTITDHKQLLEELGKDHEKAKLKMKKGFENSLKYNSYAN